MSGTSTRLPSRQRGAVAVVVGLSLVVLIGFLGLVLDLGQLFITRTELQNAADAAALAGAKELDGTVAGITRAKDRARQTAAANSVRFGGGGGAVQLGDLNIEFAPTPSGNWVPLAAALAAPGGLSFIKIDTRTPAIVQGSVSTRIMHIMNAFGLPGLPVSSVMNTYGFAVAGAYFTNVAPMGVCAVDPGNRVANDNSELVEFGFRRGMSYNIVQINDEKKGLAGLSQVPLWANPVDQYPDPCDTANNSDAVLRPYTCQGKTAAFPNIGGLAYINPGAQAAQDRFLNSRFDDFGAGCDPASAPPDTNIKEYLAAPPGAVPPVDSCPESSTSVQCGRPRDWTDPLDNVQPGRQSVLTSGSGVPSISAIADLGALWAYSPARRFDAGMAGSVGDPFALSDWPTLYRRTADNTPLGLAADTTRTSTRYGYPATTGAGFPPGTPAAPYNQPAGSKYFEAPARPGMAERRILNLMIVNCDEPAGGSGGCRTMRVLGVGRFFMTLKSNLPHNLHGEFAGLVDSSRLQSEIRLYR